MTELTIKQTIHYWRDLGKRRKGFNITFLELQRSIISKNRVYRISGKVSKVSNIANGEVNLPPLPIKTALALRCSPYKGKRSAGIVPLNCHGVKVITDDMLIQESC